MQQLTAQQIALTDLWEQAEEAALYSSSIERVMIEEMSGNASYAVPSFGGVLGIGNDHYPLPW